jgi:hypothetical protein
MSKRGRRHLAGAFRGLNYCGAFFWVEAFSMDSIRRFSMAGYIFVILSNFWHHLPFLDASFWH